MTLDQMGLAGPAHPSKEIVLFCTIKQVAENQSEYSTPMAEEEDSSKVKERCNTPVKSSYLKIDSKLQFVRIFNNPSDLVKQFVEVECRVTGKKRRYAAGTKAGFAVNLINQKLEYGTTPVVYIESDKEGEEPVSFGPDALLVDYGDGWKLQTVTLLDFSGTIFFFLLHIHIRLLIFCVFFSNR